MISKQKLIKDKNDIINNIGLVSYDLIELGNLREVGMIRLSFLCYGVEISYAEAYALWEEFSNMVRVEWVKMYKMPYELNYKDTERCVMYSLLDYDFINNCTKYAGKLKYKSISNKTIRKEAIKLIKFAMNIDPDNNTFNLVGNVLGNCFNDRIEVVDGIYITKKDIEGSSDE